MEWPGKSLFIAFKCTVSLFPSGRQVLGKNTDISKGYQRSGECADNML